jgi:hypothetical protein
MHRSDWSSLSVLVFWILKMSYYHLQLLWILGSLENDQIFYTIFIQKIDIGTTPSWKSFKTVKFIKSTVVKSPENHSIWVFNLGFHLRYGRSLIQNFKTIYKFWTIDFPPLKVVQIMKVMHIFSNNTCSSYADFPLNNVKIIF